jgi:hypothetical protein
MAEATHGAMAPETVTWMVQAMRVYTHLKQYRPALMLARRAWAARSTTWYVVSCALSLCVYRPVRQKLSATAANGTHTARLIRAVFSTVWKTKQLRKRHGAKSK